MKKYFSELLEFFSKSLSEAGDKDFKALKEQLERKLLWLQHERLIHLIVTGLFAVLLFISLLGLLCFKQTIFLLLILLLLALLIPYIWHYYFLENTTQKLYHIYDELIGQENASVYKHNSEDSNGNQF